MLSSSCSWNEVSKTLQNDMAEIDTCLRLITSVRGDIQDLQGLERNSTVKILIGYISKHRSESAEAL